MRTEGKDCPMYAATTTLAFKWLDTSLWEASNYTVHRNAILQHRMQGHQHTSAHAGSAMLTLHGLPRGEALAPLWRLSAATVSANLVGVIRCTSKCLLNGSGYNIVVLLSLSLVATGTRLCRPITSSSSIVCRVYARALCTHHL